MARAKNKINPKKIINKYINNLPKRIKNPKVFLFGSYASGNFDENSDLDFVVISDGFANINFIKRLEMLSRSIPENLYNIPMDIVGYTEEEFENIDKESIVMARAKKTGKWI